VEFLSAFVGVEQLELSGEVKDTILLRLSDLHERILWEVTKKKAQEEAESDPSAD